MGDSIPTKKKNGKGKNRKNALAAIVTGKFFAASRWLPVLVGLGVAIATLCLWQAIIVWENAQIKRTVKLEAASVKNEVTVEMKSRILALVRMAKRWENSGKPSQNEWEFEAGLNVKHFPGYQAIEWVDPSFHARWVAPPEGNKGAQDLGPAFKERRQSALVEARNWREATVTRSTDLAPDSKGFMVLVPIFQGKDFGGFILGVFRVQELLDAILDDLKKKENSALGYSIAVFDGEEEIYSRYQDNRQYEEEWGAQTEINLYGVAWRIRVWPTEKLLAEAESPLLKAALFMGLLMALLLALTVHLAQTAQLRVKKFESANKQLENQITERKRIEEKLRTIAAFSELNPAPIIGLNREGVIVSANPAASELFSAINLVGKRWASICPDVDEERLHKLYEEPGTIQQELNLDGKVLLLLYRGVPQAGMAHIYGFDITEHKRTEETLRESEMKFRSLAQSANDAIILADSSEKIILWNKGAQTIFGYRQEEILGKSLALLVSRRYGDAHIRGLEQFRLTDESNVTGKTVELRGLRKDGSEFPLELSLATWEVGEGITFYSVIIRDITERKLTDAKLYEINAALENAVEGISLLDAHGRYISLNRAYASTFSCEVNEMIGMEWQKTMYPDDLEKGLNAYKEMLKNGKAKFEARDFRKDGSIFYKEVTMIKNIDKNGQFKGHYRFIRDITERKRAEERQVRLLKELESANQELNDFAYIVSHDLKAPLRAIGSLANWISTDYADRFDEDGKEQINLLLSRVKRMHDLIDGILQYSRVGRIREEKVEVNLNELVPEVIDMIAPPENTEIEIKIESELPSISCEKTRIQQVFQNLLSNAAQYMDKPKGEIKIGCVENGSYWKLSVADNGPGIEEKYFEKIFQIFQTLSPRDEFESTGVGLSVVKKIVEMYGGKIWVESKVGYGSTFFFTLPKEETRNLIFKNVGGVRK